MPKVSVIVPNYNHALFLRQRLDSIFAQTYTDYEVILLDDCSTDNSVEILSEYSRHSKVSQFIVNSENSGSPFKQWKRGIELAAGIYIWIAESDDWAEPTFLEKMTNILEMGCGLACCRSYFIRNNQPEPSFWPERMDPDHWKSSFIHEGIQEIRQFLMYYNIIPNASSCVFTRNHPIPYEILGMKYAGDWLYWLKILEKSPIGYVPEPLNHFRIDNALSLTDKSRMEELIRFKEISKVILYARQVTSSGGIRCKECPRYAWIINIYLKKSNILGYKTFTPPFPFILSLYLYKIFIVNLTLRIVSKIAVLFRKVLK
ncbi:MAG: glycosyltransferase family 2 protein [Bacteroidetes bacterium]|nr:glycosyltransferase family 2 protein [Bacteroidota bacterium]